MDESEEFSDGLDEFEESMEERKSKPPPKTNSAYNKPYDEAFEVSNDLSVAESYDFRDKVNLFFVYFIKFPSSLSINFIYSNLLRKKKKS